MRMCGKILIYLSNAYLYSYICTVSEVLFQVSNIVNILQLLTIQQECFVKRQHYTHRFPHFSYLIASSHVKMRRKQDCDPVHSFPAKVNKLPRQQPLIHGVPKPNEFVDCFDLSGKIRNVTEFNLHMPCSEKQGENLKKIEL